MSLQIWLAFVAASGVILVIPGPTLITVMSYSISHGRRGNLPIVAGVALGDSTALALSLLGLGAVLSASAFWFTVVKIVGGLYLLFLGIKMLRSGVAVAAVDQPVAIASRWRLFAHTYIVTALNPKGIVFFIAFLPQFINPAADSGPQLWILAATFVVMGTANASLYAVFATSARRVLTSSRTQRGFNLAGGTLLSGAGIWALLAKRHG